MVVLGEVVVVVGRVLVSLVSVGVGLASARVLLSVPGDVSEGVDIDAGPVVVVVGKMLTLASMVCWLSVALNLNHFWDPPR